MLNSKQEKQKIKCKPICEVSQGQKKEEKTFTNKDTVKVDKK